MNGPDQSGTYTIVMGDTGSPKTTLMSSLMDQVPNDGRLITIEDCSELRLPEYTVSAQRAPEGSS